MAQGYKEGWFEGYDWVIRVNPDVIIRDDTYILSTVLKDEVAGIFVDCLNGCVGDKHCEASGHHIHSDFTAFRPSAIPRNITWTESVHTETMISIASNSVVDQGRDRWLPGAGPEITGQCRLSVLDESHVAHYTTGAKECVDWYKERNMTVLANL
jgi:hypothetical protein